MHTHRRRRHAVISASVFAIAAAAGSAGGLASATTEPPADSASGDTDYHWTPNEELLAGAEGQVNVIAWAGYVEDGSTDPAYDWVTPFQDMTGCAVNLQIGNTSDEMVQLMQSGEYDTVSASGDATERLIAGGEVGPLDVSHLTSYDQIFEDLKLQQWNSRDGEPYGIPHGRGANLLVYNTEAFADAAPDSWSVMFEGGTPADGAVSVYDSAIYIADAAMYLMATQPDLGITHPYSLDETQFAAAIALLEQQESLVSQYWAAAADQATALQDGSVLAGTTWQYTVNLAQSNGATVDAVKPVEGATGWSDTWMLSTKSANPNCAMLFMDWITSPWTNAQIAEWWGEAPANSESCALTASPDHCDVYHAAETEFWTDVWYWTTPTEECIDGRTDVTCVPYAEWTNAWNELRA
jgi:putative spermidine/putrescine transport system substrate-binding protein